MKLHEESNNDKENVDVVKETNPQKMKVTVEVPTPSVDEVEKYLKIWNTSEEFKKDCLQEKSLNKLFLNLCPDNTNVLDVLLKASVLNDFYSTNIFSIYPVAENICSIKNIDSRLKKGDLSLVDDIKRVIIGDIEKNFYSFATKYCSHHNPIDYPIYDGYVDEVLRYFRNRDKFAEFRNAELKNYVRFKELLIEFRKFYRLDKYNLKQIDQFIWMFGKDYFPKNYDKRKKGEI